jgi:hypothetical protein
LRCALCCAARFVALRALLRCALCCAARFVALRALLRYALCCAARFVALRALLRRALLELYGLNGLIDLIDFRLDRLST